MGAVIPRQFRLQLRRFHLWAAAAVLVWVGAAGAAALPAESTPPPGAAYLLRPLSGTASGTTPARSAHPDILDTPVLPGSIAKAVTLVAALEAGVIDAGTVRLCRRVVTVDGHTYTCTHPDLKRPLTAAEALAHSCNDFFLALAPRLSRDALNGVRGRAGLAPVAPGTPLSAALVGLDGPRVRPRVLIDVLARLAGAGPGPAVPMRPATREVLLAGLRGAADYGTASALGASRVSALAKTGTAPMPGGGTMGLVVALAPAAAPTHGVVVVAPGAAGLDAAAIAADLLEGVLRPRAPVTASTPASAPAPANAPVLRLGRTQEDGRARVEPIDLESYVSQVVTGESDPRAPDAAREALAITVRTYALANRGRHKVDGFDLCDTTHCQVVRAASAPAQRAARATAGRVLLARGRVASGFHSAWCGGHPEPASDVWPGTPDDVRAVGRDDACAGEPGWSAELRAADLERAFAAAGMRGSTLRSLRVSARTSTGRTLRVHVEGFSPSELSGQEFRTAVGRTLGWQHVKSTLFELERTASGYRVRGAGFGHGAGLCVLGAGRRAERGETVESILGFYFPGLSIGFAPHATAGGEVELALPADETSQRERVLSLVQRARAEIASRAGVPPIPLRLTVHPTVESFSRATGQPWFVAGATRGSTIDLLPTTVLRRDGQLERVIRHEIAHALVDGALEGRPLWVREGAAAYFSANASRTTGAPEGPQPRRGSSAPACPSDAELRRPQSPAAQRDAYARAAACFSSAMAGGARWQSVGSGAAPRRDAGSGAP